MPTLPLAAHRAHIRGRSTRFASYVEFIGAKPKTEPVGRPISVPGHFHLSHYMEFDYTARGAGEEGRAFLTLQGINRAHVSSHRHYNVEAHLRSLFAYYTRLLNVRDMPWFAAATHMGGASGDAGAIDVRDQ